MQGTSPIRDNYLHRGYMIWDSGMGNPPQVSLEEKWIGLHVWELYLLICERIVDVFGQMTEVHLKGWCTWGKIGSIFSKVEWCNPLVLTQKEKNVSLEFWPLTGRKIKHMGRLLKPVDQMKIHATRMQLCLCQTEILGSDQKIETSTVILQT